MLSFTHPLFAKCQITSIHCNRYSPILKGLNGICTTFKLQCGAKYMTLTNSVQCLSTNTCWRFHVVTIQVVVVNSFLSRHQRTFHGGSVTVSSNWLCDDFLSWRYWNLMTFWKSKHCISGSMKSVILLMFSVHLLNLKEEPTEWY